MSKKRPSLGRTQSRYTPDAGTVKGPVHCGVCRTLMDEKLDLHGPRSFAEAMVKRGSDYDEFQCPHRKEDWHRQVIALREKADKTPSGRLRKMFEEEADEILATRVATVEADYFWPE